MSENNQHDTWQSAEQLDQMIDQRQLAATSSLTMPPQAADTTVVTDLVQLAQSIQPDPAFVQALAARLAEQMRQDALGNVSRATGNRVTTGRNFLFPLRVPSRLAFASALLLCLLLAGLLATPSTRAALLEILFGVRQVEQRQLATLRVPVVEPVRTADSQALTLAELRARTPFPLQLPNNLPGDLAFTGGAIVEEPSGIQVSLVYHPHSERQADGSIAFGTPALLLFMATGENPALPMLDSDSLQAVTVNTHPAFYAHGGWQAEANAHAATQLENIHWDASLDADWLTWQKGAITYLLQADGLQMGQTEIIRIAESLQEVQP